MNRACGVETKDEVSGTRTPAASYWPRKNSPVNFYLRTGSVGAHSGSLAIVHSRQAESHQFTNREQKHSFALCVHMRTLICSHPISGISCWMQRDQRQRFLRPGRRTRFR